MSCINIQISTSPVDIQVVINHQSNYVELATCEAVRLAGECATRCQSEWHSSCPDTPTETHHAVSSAVSYFKGSDCVTGSLTKKFFMRIPAGCFLTSNFWKSGQPILAEFAAGSMPEREEQWKRIVSVYANRRHCCVYKTKVAFDAMYLYFTKQADNQVEV